MLNKRRDVVVIGPMGVGKTAVAARLSKIIRAPHYPLDSLKWYFLLRNGYDLGIASALLLSKGFAHKQAYFNRFFGLSEVGKILREFRGGILDFGSSHAYFTTASATKRARRLLSPFPNVVLLLPSRSHQTSCNVLDNRIRNRYAHMNWSLRILNSHLQYNRLFLNSVSYRALAKLTLYTYGRSVDAVAQEAVKKLQLLR